MESLGNLWYSKTVDATLADEIRCAELEYLSNVRKGSTEGGIYTFLHGQYCAINVPKIPALDSAISRTLTRDLERLLKGEDIGHLCSSA